jgi:beta-glucosidase-like glycosyl hydrolase
MSRRSEQRAPREIAEFTKTMPGWLRDSAPLGTSVLFHEEFLYRHAALKGSASAHPTGLASSWDRDLVQQFFSATAAEVRAQGGGSNVSSV